MFKNRLSHSRFFCAAALYIYCVPNFIFKRAVMIKPFTLALAVVLLLFTSCQGQNNTQSEQTRSGSTKKVVGGGCDGCELMFAGMPDNIQSVDTSAGWAEAGEKLMVTGTVFQIDGTTPAPDVIIYYWQTDNTGRYTFKKGMNEKAKQHGHIRGWVKTDSTGKYTIYTIRPAPYPNEALPAHIHLAIKEPDVANEYYVDDLNFDDDKLLYPYRKKNPFLNRGGSGVLRVVMKDDLQIAEHNIILGLNIPHYPKKGPHQNKSGLSIGEDQPSFMPFHAYGPDKGTRTCPVCKYGRYHGIVYFVGNNPNWEAVKKWLTFLEKESTARSRYLKAYLVYGNEKGYTKTTRQNELEKIGAELNLKQVALTFVPSFNDTESEAHLNKMNPALENTFVVYRHRTIIAKFYELKPTEANFVAIANTLDKTKSEYFNLPELAQD